MTWNIEALSPYDQFPATHHSYLIRELEDVAYGRCDRLMICMPPGHGKTKYASINFPAWFLAQDPAKIQVRGNIDVIGASYNSEYAEWISSEIIALVQENSAALNYRLINRGAKLWRTTNRGAYRAAGADTGITGRRADLFIIDDAIKGRKDADSQTIRDNVWNWYRAEVLTRLKPKARVVVINTRWHHDDLSGRLLNEMHLGADQWRVIVMPAFAEPTPDMPDPLGRAEGEALWPEWEDRAALIRKRDAVGPREWICLFQQRPTPFEGSLFKASKIGTLETEPKFVQVCRSWDLAGTEARARRSGSGPDWTVGIKMGRTEDDRYVIADIVRMRGGPEEVMDAITSTASLDGRQCTIRLPEDPGQAGKAQSLQFAKALAGYKLEIERETGDKETRAKPVASQVNVGNVLMVRTQDENWWGPRFRDELTEFPSGTFDDQVDALSGAFRVVGLGKQGMTVDQQAVARLAGLNPRARASGRPMMTFRK